jgi:hypothetical protein
MPSAKICNKLSPTSAGFHQKTFATAGPSFASTVTPQYGNKLLPYYSIHPI